MKAALNKAKPSLDAMPSAKPAPVSAKPVIEEKPMPPKKASGATANEKWLSFVDLVRNDDAIFAAKIENLLFGSEEGKTLRLGVPPKLTFLKDQMSDSHVRKKLQGYIDSYWGDGYSFDVSMSRDPGGETGHALLQKKVQLAEDDLRTKINEHPMVKAAQAAFKGQIKSVTEIKNRN
jgi:DNA polymerase-3 subunit gamma/tau